MEVVVSANEMRRLEALAIERGGSEEAYMEEAGKNIALSLLKTIEKENFEKRVLLVVGKGNNGGDAFSAGRYLLEAGIQVHAICPFEVQKRSKLNQKNEQRFLQAGGNFKSVTDDFSQFRGVILDGLLGTGFKGNLDTKLESLIEKVNKSLSYIISIDIPSGLDGNTGEVKSFAIQAHETISLGLYKSGYFLKEGINHVGKLKNVSFGLSKQDLAEAKPYTYLVSREFGKNLFLKPKRNRHKYEAGYVLGFAGSTLFKGAPKLAGLASLLSGAGIVRVMHQGEIGECPYSLITEEFSLGSWRAEAKRASSFFFGPGISTLENGKALFRTLLGEVKAPLVIDADALIFDFVYPEGAVLTPHRGEAIRLLGLESKTSEESLFEAIQKYVEETNTILVLKGAPTWIFSKNELPLVLPFGDPAMAKAGMGDVLTGVIAGLMAAKIAAPRNAAILGVLMHSLAGEKGALQKGPYSLLAEDVLKFIPSCIQEHLNRDNS